MYCMEFLVISRYFVKESFTFCSFGYRVVHSSDLPINKWLALSKNDLDVVGGLLPYERVDRAKWEGKF